MSNMVENDLAGVAAEKAALLRMLQVELADKPEAARAEALRRSLEEMVAAVPADRRPAFLGELSRRFPSWANGGGSGSGSGSGGGAVRPPAAQPTPAPAAAAQPPAALVEQLCRAAPSMSADARAEVVRRLAAAGFPLPAAAGGAAPAPAATPAAGASAQSPPAQNPSAETIYGPLRELLKIDPAQPLDPVRVGQLVKQVLSLVMLSDPVVWGMWQQKIARGDNSVVSKGRARDEAKAWLTGGGDPQSTRMLVIVDDLRRLVAAMGCTLADTPPQVDTALREKLDPARFEEAIALGGFQHTGAMGGNRRETECWRRFVEAYKEIVAKGGFEVIAQKLITDTVKNYYTQPDNG